MLDQNRGENTFQIEGILRIKNHDLKNFNFVSRVANSLESMTVVRVLDSSGKTRDVAFHFGWGSNGSSTDFYIEHQDYEGVMYRGYFELPNFAQLSIEKGVTKEGLMRKLAAFIVSKNPQIIKPGIKYPEGHDLSVDIMEEWVAQL